MKVKKIKEAVKKSWNWICDLDSVFKWAITLALICIIVIFIFFLILPLIFGSSLSLAGVESSSMSHQMKIIGNDSSELRLCKDVYLGQEKKQRQVDFNEYWESCGEWYEKRNISKQTFLEFPLKNGFEKGDMIVVLETSELRMGDIIVFKKNSEFTSKLIVHRIISIEENIIQTKGDSNTRQFFGMNETNIAQERIVGKAVLKIPYFGWPKIWVKELIDAFKKSNLEN